MFHFRSGIFHSWAHSGRSAGNRFGLGDVTRAAPGLNWLAGQSHSTTCFDDHIAAPATTGIGCHIGATNSRFINVQIQFNLLKAVILISYKTTFLSLKQPWSWRRNKLKRTATPCSFWQLVPAWRAGPHRQCGQQHQKQFGRRWTRWTTWSKYFNSITGCAVI